MLAHHKDKINVEQRINVVYNIIHKDCLQYYVEESGTKLKVHQAAIQRHEETSLVQEHTTNNG